MRSFPGFAIALVVSSLITATTFADKATKSGIETSHISSDFVGAAIYHPRQFLNSKLMQATIKEWDKVEKKETSTKLFAQFKKEVGVDPRQVDQIALLIDRDLVRSLPSTIGLPMPGSSDGGGGAGPAGGGRSTTPIVSYIVRFHGKLSVAEQKQITRLVINLLRQTGMGVTRRFGSSKKGTDPLDATDVRKHDGQSYRVLESMGICFVKDRTLLVSHESLLKRMISAKTAKSPFLTRLASLPPKQDAILAADMQPFETLFKTFASIGGAFPPDVGKLIDYLSKTKTLAITAGIEGKTIAYASAKMPDKTAATGFAKLINDSFLPQLKKFWKAERHSVSTAKSSFSKFFVSVLDQTLDGVSVKATGTEASITVERPTSLDKFPMQAAPIVKRIKDAQQRNLRKNNMKMIGLAFHNYHDIYSRFPGHGSDATGKRKGLSWRVHLLPSLDQSKLYEKFKLDEPWDSKHNKKLIDQMPAVFKSPGVTAKNKTSIHVFVGKGTPFGLKSGGVRFRDVVDGTSNTILAVEAGADKADIWTKPGGLPFDPKKDPLKSLGKLKEDGFLMLLMDGSVRYVHKKIRTTILKRLIQHQDGMVIGEF